MSDFEDDIVSRMSTQNEAIAKARVDEERHAREQAELRARALKIGSEVVRSLHGRGIPTTPVWVKKKIKEAPFVGRQSWKGGTHSGVDHVFEYQQAGEAWKVLNTYSTDEGYGINDRLALSGSGELLQYNFTETHPDGRLVLGPKSEGIVSPGLIHPERSIELLESDLFKDACAHLIRTCEPLDAEDNLFLHFNSQPLDDGWQTKL